MLLYHSYTSPQGIYRTHPTSLLSFLPPGGTYVVYRREKTSAFASLLPLQTLFDLTDSQFSRCPRIYQRTYPSKSHLQTPESIRKCRSYILSLSNGKPALQRRIKKRLSKGFKLYILYARVSRGRVTLSTLPGVKIIVRNLLVGTLK